MIIVQRTIRIVLVVGLHAILTPLLSAQVAYRPVPSDTLHSPIVGPDRTITFRLYAPHADTVQIGGTDLPAEARREKMRRNENGVWEVTRARLYPERTGIVLWSMAFPSSTPGTPRSANPT
jgi:hypothetical protein